MREPTNRKCYCDMQSYQFCDRTSYGALVTAIGCSIEAGRIWKACQGRALPGREFYWGGMELSKNFTLTIVKGGMSVPEAHSQRLIEHRVNTLSGVALDPRKKARQTRRERNGLRRAAFVSFLGKPRLSW